jgi:hypothetical protein
MTKARQEMEALREETRAALAQYEEAEWLHQRGLNALSKAPQRASAGANDTLNRLIPRFARFEECARTRLSCAIELLEDPSTPELKPLRDEAARLIPVFACLTDCLQPLEDLRRKFSSFAAAFRSHGNQALTAEAEARLLGLEPELLRLVNQIGQRIKEVPYPFLDEREDLTLDGLVRNDRPANHRLEALGNDCSFLLNGLLPLYERVLGRLAFIALQVEKKT